MIKDMPWLFLTLSPPHPIFKSCLLYGALPKCPKSPHLGGLPLARWLSSSSRVPHSSSRLCTAHPHRTWLNTHTACPVAHSVMLV